MSSVAATFGRCRRLLIAGEFVCGALAAIGALLIGATGAVNAAGGPSIGAILLLASTAAFCAFWFPLLYANCFANPQSGESKRFLPAAYWLIVGVASVFWLFLAALLLGLQ
jgi:hypothetical protein